MGGAVGNLYQTLMCWDLALAGCEALGMVSSVVSLVEAGSVERRGNATSAGKLCASKTGSLLAMVTLLQL